MAGKTRRAEDGRTRAVLVADANPAVADIMARALRQEGYAVVLAGDGATALGLLSSRRFGLLIAEAALDPAPATLERAAAAAGAAVIFATGDGRAIHAFEAEGRAFLRKPFPLADLLAATEAALA